MHGENAVCGQSGPWRLSDCGTCIRTRGHEQQGGLGAWHSDGKGYIWDDTRWQWNGPTIDLREYYEPDDPPRPPVFIEQPPTNHGA